MSDSVEPSVLESALAEHFGWAMPNATASSVGDFLYDWLRENLAAPPTNNPSGAAGVVDPSEEAAATTCHCDSDLVLPHPRGSAGCASADPSGHWCEVADDVAARLSACEDRLAAAVGRARAEERQRIAAELRALLDRKNATLLDNAAGRRVADERAVSAVSEYVDALAAGSAVPVATPEPGSVEELARRCGECTEDGLGDCQHGCRERPGPVATPTEPGRQLQVMEAHRLQDCADPPACWYEPHRSGKRLPAEQDGQR